MKRASRDPPPSAHILHLPAELITKILAQKSIRPADLFRAAQVCRALRPLALSRRFRKVALTFYQESEHNPCGWVMPHVKSRAAYRLASQPHLAAHIRELELEFLIRDEEESDDDDDGDDGRVIYGKKVHEWDGAPRYEPEGYEESFGYFVRESDGEMLELIHRWDAIVKRYKTGCTSALAQVVALVRNCTALEVLTVTPYALPPPRIAQELLPVLPPTLRRLDIQADEASMLRDRQSVMYPDEYRTKDVKELVQALEARGVELVPPRVPRRSDGFSSSPMSSSPSSPSTVGLPEEWSDWET
ncbi:hypothetical protein JCM10450v2_008257 [Rhodotorula kratochvilovae]